MNNPEPFADKVRRLRKGAGLTQAQFAERLFISRDYLSQIENGREPGDRLVHQVELLEKVGIPRADGADSVGTADVLEEPQFTGAEPSERQRIEAWVKNYLDLAERVPGGMGFAWGKVCLSLDPADLQAMAAHAARPKHETTEEKLARLKTQVADIRGGAGSSPAVPRKKVS